MLLKKKKKRFIIAMFVRKIWSPNFSSPYANHIKYIN